MSQGISPASQQVYFSTHNALHLGDSRDEKIKVYVVELGGSGVELAFSVFPFCDVEMIKRLIIKKVRLPKSTNISDLKVFYRGNELPNYRSLNAFGERSRFTVRLHWTFSGFSNTIGVREVGLRPPPALQELLPEINLAFKRGIAPKLTMDGTGGTYILYNTNNQTSALFKPRDEESFTPNNPRGYEGKLGQRGFRSGVLSGEGSIREVAAFLLDAQYGSIVGVPQTTKVESCHPSYCNNSSRNSQPVASGLYQNFSLDAPPFSSSQVYWKEGSLQQFVDAKESCGDFDSRVFSVADAHLVGILDIRVFNLDRNDGNLLVASNSSIMGAGSTSNNNSNNSNNNSQGQTCSIKSDEDNLTPDGKTSRFRLIPIDHGLILPDTMEVGDIDLVWYHWPHSKIHFTENELRHIFSLDPDKDAARLARKLEIRDECLRTMRVSTRVLQIGARMHLNLFQITSLLVRFDDFEHPSITENLVKTALAQAYTAVDSTSLMRHFRLPNSVLLDLHLPQKPHTVPTVNKTGIKAVQFSPCQVSSAGDVSNGNCRQERVENCEGRKLIGEIDNSNDEHVDERNNHLVQSNSDNDHCEASGMAKLDKPALLEGFHLFNSSSPADITAHWDSTGWDSGSVSTPSSSTGSSCDEKDTSDSEKSDANTIYPSKRETLVSKFSGVPLEEFRYGGKNRRRKQHRQRNPSNVQKGPNLKIVQEQDACLPLTTPSTPNGLSPQNNSANCCQSVNDVSQMNSRSDSVGGSKKKQAQSNSLNDFSDVVVGRSGTRRRTTALQRRGTNSRTGPPNANSTWLLMDSNKNPIPLDWLNPLFEKMFFDSLEILIKHSITAHHPEWPSYTYQGQSLDSKGPHPRRKHSCKFDK